jgi:hypothetical protein
VSGTSTWVGASPEMALDRRTKTNQLTALPTIGVSPGLGRRINVAPFRRRITIAEMLHGLLSGRSPDDAGGAA